MDGLNPGPPDPDFKVLTAQISHTPPQTMFFLKNPDSKTG